MAKMTFTVGDVFYKAGVNDDGTVDVDEWHLRTIRKGRGFLTLKAEYLTWDRSGWMRSIPHYCRQAFHVEPAGLGQRGLPAGFAKSRSAALALAVTSQIAYIARCRLHDDEPAYIAAMERGLVTLKRMRTKAQNAKKRVA